MTYNCFSFSAFTVERYLAVCRPLHTSFSSTTRRAIKIQICLWVIAILSSTPYLYITKRDQQCYFDPDFQSFVKKCVQISATFFFVVPAFILCVLYALMARRLYSASFFDNERWSKTSGMESYSSSIRRKPTESDKVDHEEKFKNNRRASSASTSMIKKNPSIRRGVTGAPNGQPQINQSMKKSAFKMLCKDI